MDGPTVLLINLIVGGAACVTSLAGFGYALVATPFLVLLFPARSVVPMVLLSSTPLCLLLAWKSRAALSPGRIGLWLTGAVIGGPLGAWGLATIAEGGMRRLIGALTLLAALTIWLKPARPFRRETLPGWGAGCLSGILGGASGMSGPPIILLGLNQGWDFRGFRADLLGYFLVLHAGILAVFGGVGILDTEVLILAGWAAPGLLVGYVGGTWLTAYVSQARFRLIAFVLVAVGGSLALIR